jgi:predicted dehydrogenase
LGAAGRIEVEIPFGAPADRPCRVTVDDCRDLFGTGSETLHFDSCDQYQIQGDLFSQAILENREQPIPLEDAVANMRVLDAVFRAAAAGRWETPRTADR